MRSGHRRTAASHAKKGRQVPRGTVATYSVPGHGFAHSHERATRDSIARRLAALKGFDFAGEYDPAQSSSWSGLPRAERHPGRPRRRQPRSGCGASTTCSAASCPTPSSPPRRSLTRSSGRTRRRRLAGPERSGCRCTTPSSPASRPSRRGRARGGRAPAGARSSARQAGAGDGRAWAAGGRRCRRAGCGARHDGRRGAC